MKPEARKFIVDIIQSIEIVESYNSQLHSYAEFANNQQAKDAIERRLGIIGEALNKAIKIDDTIAVTNSRKIMD